MDRSCIVDVTNVTVYELIIPPNFPPVYRLILALLLVPAIGAASGQSLANDTTAALSFTRSVSVPLNALKLYDRALEAWTWTFGQEPGAQLLRADREQGVIEGIARVNFRSEMLTNREESMGTIQYRVIINIRPGESRTVVTELNHTGNRNAPRNGIHLGLVTRSIAPAGRVPGMGRSNAIRLYAEVKQQATARIQTVMQSFDSRLRAGSDP
jgi:hypothetical protein